MPVAVFNDAGLMLQAVEQNLGLALSRELLAADALADGRLVQRSPLTITDEPAFTYYLVYPPNLPDWPPLAALRQWLRDELEQSRRMLHPPEQKKARTRNARSNRARSRSEHEGDDERADHREHDRDLHSRAQQQAEPRGHAHLARAASRAAR